MAQMTFYITLIFILGSVLVSIFISGRSRDRCLKDFDDDTVRVIFKEAPQIDGKLALESSGMEITFGEKVRGENGEMSYILFKNEYPNIARILRIYEELSPKEKEARDQHISGGYYYNQKRSTARKLRNLFSTFRDSFMEALNLFMGQAKIGGSSPLAGQDKYIKKVKSEVVGSIERAYDPLIEKHIGHKVVLVEVAGEAKNNYIGVLKEYSPNFVEILDIQVEGLGKVDIIFPRATTKIRHMVE
ncbi:MAG: hypothetical protein HQ558_01025 [Candidatus Omnitrophica bacterium]|nr:hypothetical protein [Candidatus Omnitrophota bacterium]